MSVLKLENWNLPGCHSAFYVIILVSKLSEANFIFVSLTKMALNFGLYFAFKLILISTKISRQAEMWRINFNMIQVL